MATYASTRVRFDAQRLAEDMALKGWNKGDMAARAGVADMTVIRFLRGERQTASTAKKLAAALGYSVRRYVISSREMPLDEARAAVGRVVRRVIKRTDSVLKHFGDKGQVARWCAGQENPNFATFWQRPETRRELVLAMAEESGLADVQMTVVLRKVAS